VFHFIGSGSRFTTLTSTLISSPTATFLFLKFLPHHLFLSDNLSPTSDSLSLPAHNTIFSLKRPFPQGPEIFCTNPPNLPK